MELFVDPGHTRYAVFFFMEEDRTLAIGKLGTYHFLKGRYIYIGSAKKNILARVNRHLKVDTVFRWHFDYLRPYGTITEVKSFDDKVGECELAECLKLRYLATYPMKKFGSSDCRCYSHLLFLRRGCVVLIVKERGISMELQVFRCLKHRMVFSEKERMYHLNLEKGYEGELKFDELTKNVGDNCLIVNDITLEVTNNLFQIDSLLICKDMICMFEVKNFEDNFFIQSHKWYLLSSRKEVNNPILQLDRSETLLRKYLHTHRFSVPIESKVVFVHPTFTLYQAPIDLPAIFPTQLQQLQSTIESKRGVLTTQHTKLAKQLCDDHVTSTPFLRVPSYSYESLRKGIKCRGCGEFFVEWGESILHCQYCGNSEFIVNAFVRTVEAYRLLFPTKKITTKEIYIWCEIIPSLKVTRSLLNNYFQSVGNGRSKYYK
ncbi:DUF123 domain-containing protein [Robertmurraya korlensis]|uniref:DUF123 domain-containing protein n=1 Tax=Robertmurraya korlensis TaxID=519977 RepID=UPI000825B2EC|nr:DUF123 domain-containing protein [Robertmurraya korlensis]